MDEALRAALLFFALLAALGAVPVALRRLQPPSVFALHLLGLATVAALVLVTSTGRGQTAGLLAPYAVAALMTLLFAAGPGGRDPAPRRLAVAGAIVAAIGALSAAPGLPWARPLAGVSAIGLAALALWVARELVLRAQRRQAPAQASADRGGALAALLIASTAAAMGAFSPALGIAVVALGAAGGIITAVRVPPFVAPPGRELLSAALLALATCFAAFAARGRTLDIVWGVEVGLAALGILAIGRPLLLLPLGTRRPASRPAPVSGEPRAPPLAVGALAHLNPLIDDVTLQRPSRPRVNARISARRLLESALHRARASRPPHVRASLDVEIREDEADVDIEGDPGELADALCAVLDNALGFKERFPQLYVRVHVRGSAAHVTFEVSDDLAAHDELAAAGGPRLDTPFALATSGGGRPGHGVGLSRARVIVERHGGHLLARRTGEGSCVQLTLPRRRHRRPELGRA